MSDADDEDDLHERTIAVPLKPAQIPGRKDKAYLIVLTGASVGEMHCITEALVLGRGSEADVRIVGDAVSRRHARVVMRPDATVFVEDLGSTNGTFVNGSAVGLQTLNDGDKIQIGSSTILKFTYHDELEEDFQRELYDSALRDGLTRAFNKKFLQDRLVSEFAFAVRHRAPLSLLLFDIDHFKQINDTYGHQAGDHVLSLLAKTVAASIRSEDIFARYGGEEFAILCRGIGAAPALLLATRIRQTIQTTSFRYEAKDLRVTISLGVATVPDPDIRDTQGFVGAADAALYEAKRGGRNCVVVKPIGTPPDRT